MTQDQCIARAGEYIFVDDLGKCAQPEPVHNGSPCFVEHPDVWRYAALGGYICPLRAGALARCFSGSLSSLRSMAAAQFLLSLTSYCRSHMPPACP